MPVRAAGACGLCELGAAQYGHDVACGLAAMHGHTPYPVMHRDLHSDNILITTDRAVVASSGAPVLPCSSTVLFHHALPPARLLICRSWHLRASGSRSYTPCRAAAHGRCVLGGRDGVVLPVVIER